jgi:hypothetical protein
MKRSLQAEQQHQQHQQHQQYSLAVTLQMLPSAVSGALLSVLCSAAAAAVNDPPSFIPGPSSITVTEDSSTYAAQWASAVSAGPGETDPALAFTVSCSSTAAFTMFTAPPQLTSAGMLTFTPAANAYGSSVCNVTLVDGGGLRSASSQLTVVVTPGA